MNATVDAIGFDFIQPPRVSWEVGPYQSPGDGGESYFLKLIDFESKARVRGEDKYGGFETFSMLMLDYDYDEDTFDFDVAFYADELEANDWTLEMPAHQVGASVMAIFIDIFGNEAREVISRDDLASSVSNLSEMLAADDA